MTDAPPRTPKQTQPKQTPKILVENFVPIPSQKMIRARMDLLLPNIFGKTDKKVMFSSEVIQRIDTHIKFASADKCITEKSAINICVKPKENACHFPFILLIEVGNVQQDNIAELCNFVQKPTYLEQVAGINYMLPEQSIMNICSVILFFSSEEIYLCHLVPLDMVTLQSVAQLDETMLVFFSRGSAVLLSCQDFNSYATLYKTI